MSTLKVNTLTDTAATKSVPIEDVVNGTARAWVNFNGFFGTSPFTIANGGIRAAYNVSSVTDNNAGDYTVNFTTAFPDAKYNMVGSASNGTAANFAANRIIGIYADAGGVGASAPTTSSCRIATIFGTESRTDCTWINASFFR